MNPLPGTSWPDLHYLDTEQVELDVQAIITRGARLRRKRLITKISAVVLVVGVAPAVVIADMAAPVVINGPEGVRPAPKFGLRQPPMVLGHGVSTHSASPFVVDSREEAPAIYANVNELAAGEVIAGHGGGGDDLMFSLAPAQVRRSATLSLRYGPLLAVAGARAGDGLWFAATAAQLTLFHLSIAGALKSWALPTPASSVRADAGVGLAVTAAGVAWIGVGATLLSLDTRSARLSTWQVPAGRAGAAAHYGALPRHQPTWNGRPLADSVAVSPDGRVAVATARSSSVQVLDPRDATFRQISLPSAVDHPLAVGYARNGTLGIGYQHLGTTRAGEVLLVKPTGARRSAQVPQPTAIAAYGASGLLVGVNNLYVVPERGRPRPLIVPAGSADLATVATPPAPLPSNRLGIAMGSAILTFPATAVSSTTATSQSALWVVPPPSCRPHHGCPAGFQLVATDYGGDLWVVPKADPRTVELVSLR